VLTVALSAIYALGIRFQRILTFGKANT
jgi:hypothetical protein